MKTPLENIRECDLEFNAFHKNGEPAHFRTYEVYIAAIRDLFNDKNLAHLLDKAE